MQLTDRSGVTDGEESENDFTTNGWGEGDRGVDRWTDRYRQERVKCLGGMEINCMERKRESQGEGKNVGEGNRGELERKDGARKEERAEQEG